jgi:hypothetical protein
MLPFPSAGSANDSSPFTLTQTPFNHKIGYGLAMPGLIAGATISVHLSAIFAFVKFLRGSRHLQSNTVTHWVTWLSLVFGMTVFAFIIGNVIPLCVHHLRLLIHLCARLFRSLMLLLLLSCSIRAALMNSSVSSVLSCKSSQLFQESSLNLSAH